MSTYLPKLNKQQEVVEIKCVTWVKDSHGLFDYESKSIQVKKYRVDTPCKIYRNDSDIVITDSSNTLQPRDENLRVLTAISQYGPSTETHFFIEPQQFSKDVESPVQNDKNNQSDNNQQLETSLIVRSLKNKEGQQKGYSLKLDDVIKLGRIEYAVIEVNDENNYQRVVKDLFCDESQYTYTIDFSKKLRKTCKICLLEEDQEEDNPFISPCACKGSCQYVHFLCLQKWVESKVSKKSSGNTVSYKWKKLECEVCKMPLPKKIFVNNKEQELIHVERPQCPYIILESISREKRVSKGLFLIHSMVQDVAKLGRGHQCDIRISDISVSRCHAYIKYDSGNFLIIDNNSKFGTLIKLSKPYPILTEKVAIQVGRTVITFVLKSLQSIQNYQSLLNSQKMSQSTKPTISSHLKPKVANGQQQQQQASSLNQIGNLNQEKVVLQTEFSANNGNVGSSSKKTSVN